MESKKSLIFILLTIIILIVSKYYVKFLLLGLSFTSMLLSYQKKNIILFCSGMMGIFVVSIMENNSKKIESYQNQNQRQNNISSDLPKRKECTDEQKQVTRVLKSDFIEMKNMFTKIFLFSENEAENLIKNECLSSIFDCILASKHYLNRNDYDLNNWKASDKMIKVSLMYPIFNFDIDTIFSLISEEISSIDSNFTELIIEKFGIDSVQKRSLDYYLSNKVFSNKHFKLVETLNIAESNDKEAIINISNSTVYFNKKLKDIASLMILLESPNKDTTWVSDEDLNSLYMVDDIDGDKWVFDTLSEININNEVFNNNEIFKRYSVKNKIIETLKNMEEKRDKELQDQLIDFSSPINTKFDEIQLNFEKSAEAIDNNKKNEEYKTFTVDNSDESKEISELKNIKTIHENAMDTYFNITTEVGSLIKSLSESNSESNSTGMKAYFDKYLAFVKEFLKIIVKENRIFYVGIFLILLSIIFNFVEISR